MGVIGFVIFEVRRRMKESAAYQQGLRQRELAVRAPAAWSQPGERSWPL
jgi:hypothetical protein